MYYNNSDDKNVHLCLIDWIVQHLTRRLVYFFTSAAFLSSTKNSIQTKNSNSSPREYILYNCMTAISILLRCFRFSFSLQLRSLKLFMHSKHTYTPLMSIKYKILLEIRRDIYLCFFFSFLFLQFLHILIFIIVGTVTVRCETELNRLIQ